ncbi:MAG: hypothetical protein FJW20_24815 [Acidimicrobiia bacterium]|nr:hypothetical protein [Acidimicrobiia bacterium]
MSRIAWLLMVAGTRAASDWPEFRGADANGLGVGDPAVHWNADPAAGAVKGVAWKTPIPGLSHSSPIVWKDLWIKACLCRS